MTRQKRIDSNLLYVFLSVPLLSSVMSAIHLVNMVKLGNPMFMAIALAVTFELGSIVSFVAMSKNILKKLKKEALYIIFAILFLLQAFGNVYSSFDYIRRTLLVDPTWLTSFREMFFNAMDITSTKLILACLIGLPIPLISLILLKSAIDYFSADADVEPSPESSSEPEIVSPVIQDEKKDEAQPFYKGPTRTFNTRDELFDERGNVKGAKTYDAPAVIAENAQMSAAPDVKIPDQVDSSSPGNEIKLENSLERATTEPVVEPELETKPEILPLETKATAEPVRVQEKTVTPITTPTEKKS